MVSDDKRLAIVRMTILKGHPVQLKYLINGGMIDLK